MTNLLCLEAFKETRQENQEEIRKSDVEKVLFSILPSFQFHLELGLFESEYEGEESYTHSLTLKGTDTVSYGMSEESVRAKMIGLLMDSKIV